MGQAENDYEKYSSIADVIRLLARELPRSRAELFLNELANLRTTEEKSVSRFQEKHSDFIPVELRPDLVPPELRRIRYVSIGKPSESGLHKVQTLSGFALRLQFLLKSAWECPTPEERTMHLGLTLHAVYVEFFRANAKKPPHNSPVHTIWKAFGNIAVALTRAQRVADRMRKCENPSCPAPYFIAKRRNQKYCSEVCARPAQQEQKRAWWDSHGAEWKSKRKKNKAS